MKIIVIFLTLLTFLQAKETPQSMSKFEKMFVNHLAYINYNDSINALYNNDYKKAYTLAMEAKNIFKQDETKLIPLAYMPSYLRETAYAPKKIYYKVVVHKTYELHRLVTKIKLMSPPMASVVVKRSSTNIEIIIRNYGDLPLDNFELLIDGQSIIKYNKINPNDEKRYIYEKAPQIHEIAFHEEYGFAPNAIVINEGY